jgi:hypothetical protein
MEWCVLDKLSLFRLRGLYVLYRLECDQISMIFDFPIRIWQEWDLFRYFFSCGGFVVTPSFHKLHHFIDKDHRQTDDKDGLPLVPIEWLDAEKKL